MNKDKTTAKEQGLLVVISGFSGAGKSAITRKLIHEYDHYAYSVSATTRNPRPGEADGIDYHFISKEDFETMIRENRLLEYNCYVGNYYGTPRDFVMKQTALGKDVILEIDVNGARQVRESFPDALTLFVTAPNADILAGRLKGRGTETAEVIKKRLSQALRETDEAEKYDYLIINDDLDQTVERMDRLIQNQHMKVERQSAYLKTFKEKMSKLLEEI